MIFFGIRPPQQTARAGKVYVIDEETFHRLELLPERSIAVERFQNGFGWGYTGDGALQLALALLLETTNNERLSRRLCDAFRDDYIANFTDSCWALHRDDILEWINSQSS